jgi:hypothetical protein
VPDAQSLSSDGGNSPTEFGSGHALAFEHVEGPLQPAALGVWPSVQRTVQVVVDCGWEREGVPEDGCVIVHLTPARADLMRRRERLRRYRWSSWPEYLTSMTLQWIAAAL